MAKASGKQSQEFMIGTAAELADLFGARAETHEREGTFPYENYDDLRRSGFHLASVPEEYGGWGGSVGAVTRAMARLGEGCGSTALVVSMHLVQTARAMIAGWPAAPLEMLLTGIVKHGHLYNNAASEPATGSPSRGGLPTTTATPLANGGYVLNGRKTWTTGSPVLHFISVTAAVQSGGQEKPQVGNFLLTRTMPGLRIEETWNSLSMRLTASHDLVLENVLVGPEGVLGSKRLPPILAATNTAWTLPVAAVYFGVGRAAAKYAVQFARDRRPNSLNQSIAELAHIQEKAGRMELALLSAENTLFAVADLADAGEAERNSDRLAALVGAAKQLATNRAIEAVDLAMRIVGGASLSMEGPLQRYYRDVRAGLHNPPMDDVSTLALGKLVLGVKGS